MEEQRVETIVAPATAPGEGGIGIVRVSGPLAETLLQRFFRGCLGPGPMISHRFYHGRFVSGEGKLIDEVLAVLMRRPRSYTREDVAEIQCHGGTVVMQQILDSLIDGGARLAQPGEFTLRAFLNGRIDLTEAEAVIDLIRSRSESACNVALSQLEGKLSAVIRKFRDELVEILALVEAYIDFPEEEIELPQEEKLRAGIEGISGRIDDLLATFDTGRVLRDGMAVLILGRPNVGKSSLMNALLGEARAIVTEVAGTTRDTIEENLCLNGLPLRLVDTAGVRHTSDPVEVEGVRRARAKVVSADLVLLVLDGSRVPGDDDLLALEACRDKRVLLVFNKCDLPVSLPPPPFQDLPLVRVSALTGAGLDELRNKMTGFFSGGKGWDSRESVMLSDRRHRQALVRCRDSLDRFLEGIKGGVSPEFLALELRAGLQSLGEITGETTPDVILEKIFTRFCIGK